jgi:hypothetical protein
VRRRAARSDRYAACITQVVSDILRTMPRHKSLERPPAGRSIRIDLQGEAYDGTYTVDGSMVTVESLTLGVRCARLSDASAEAVARLLLAEMVDEHERRKRR